MTATSSGIVRSPQLDASDRLLDASDTFYPTGDAKRDLEKHTDQFDAIMLSTNRRTLTMEFRTYDNVDQVRVLTKAVS